ncbi:MAG: alpha/beta fold hydrolase [Pyrinomonadaceae bacterium]
MLRRAILIAGVLLAMPPTCFSKEYSVKTPDGVSLYVKVAGSGPPCLFIHGGPGQGSLSFEKIGGDSLEKHLTMIYVDQRGSGKSASAKDYSLDRMADDIEQVRKRLGYRKLNLLAHSFGGIIAVRYAAKYPKRVARIVMANTTLHFYNDEALKGQLRFFEKELNKDYGLGEPIATEDLRKTVQMVRNNSGIGYKLLTDSLETLRKMGEVDGYPGRNREFGRFVMGESKEAAEYYADYTNASKSVNVPTLIIAGTRDYAVGVYHHLRFRFPNSKIETIKGGHLLYADNNEEFVMSVNRFVNGKFDSPNSN